MSIRNTARLQWWAGYRAAALTVGVMDLWQTHTLIHTAQVRLTVTILGTSGCDYTHTCMCICVCASLPEGYQPWPWLMPVLNQLGQKEPRHPQRQNQLRPPLWSASMLHEWGLLACPHECMTSHKLPASCVSTRLLFDAISSSHNLPVRENPDHLLL